MTNMTETKQKMTRRLLALSAVATCICAPAVAFNPPRTSSADLVSMLNAQLAPDVKPAYYSVTNSGHRFLLDRSGPHALIQFDNADEVIALRVSNGPRGDEFYRTDTGHTLLRITELGNVIIYPAGLKKGMPTALDASASAIIPPPHPSDLNAEILGLESNLQSQYGIQARFQISDNLTDYADWTLEAAKVVTLGVANAGSQSSGTTIQLSMGQQPALSYAAGVLSVTISPADGYGGRPSSKAIAYVLSK